MAKETKQIALPVQEPEIPLDSQGRVNRDQRRREQQKREAARLDTVVFDEQNRAPACIEKDFPILPVNELSSNEGNAGKPVYQMSKWWARRRSSIFRAALLSAGLSAPPESTVSAAKYIWDAFYLDHQTPGTFSRLRLLDPFMGGGTTLVEGSRLGYETYGKDLNPVAWLIVTNEMSMVPVEAVRSAFSEIERSVRPVLSPFYTTSCPRGHHGHWIDTRTDRPTSVDPMALPPIERLHYKWHGPEVVYTFWAKHGTCAGEQCGHRTPVMRSPIIAIKRLTVQYIDMRCPSCGLQFHVELGETRIAPGAMQANLDQVAHTALSQQFASDLRAYSSGRREDRLDRASRMLEEVEQEAGLYCPNCGAFVGDPLERILRNHSHATRVADIAKSDFEIRSKQVCFSLLLAPQWLEGSSGSVHGQPLGGYAGAPVDATEKWLRLRAKDLELVEIRGSSGDHEGSSNAPKDAREDTGEEVDARDIDLPSTIKLPDGRTISTNIGTVPLKSTFTCQACGRPNNFLEAVKHTGVSAPVAPYAVQCYCPECEAEGYGYGGRYFKAPDAEDINHLVAAEQEWAHRSATDLQGFWPEEGLPYAWMTHHLNGGIPNWGYTHWAKMFNGRQLLVHSVLLKAIMELPDEKASLAVKEQVLGAFQQYLRNQNMFCFWNMAADKLEPMMSNANYHPKATVVENSVFGPLGRGNWISCMEGTAEGLTWCRNPWDRVLPTGDEARRTKAFVGDSVRPPAELLCGSSTDLSHWRDGFFDLAVTDPPFGDNLFYADLADFFYVWLRIPMLKWYAGRPEVQYWLPPATPKTLEAIRNRAEHADTRTEEDKRDGVPEPAEEFYKTTLTACWSEVCRVLKPGGILAFTFHHSAHEPWVSVLESLFDAGFILLATYPVRSDETKGESAAFGARKIEYDILHVCRKRSEEPTRVSWARMRSWVKDEVMQLRTILELGDSGLTPADTRVILLGKALEFFSRHYGQVYVGDDVLSVRDALIGIDQLLVEIEDPGRDFPGGAEPITTLFLTHFHNQSFMHRDDLHKMLRGMPVTVDEFLDRGWIEETDKVVSVVPIAQRFERLRQRRQETLRTDLDQAHFLIGSAYAGSSSNILDELARGTLSLKPSVEDILNWYSEKDRDEDTREAAGRALRLVQQWKKDLQRRPSRRTQQTLLSEEGEPE